MATSSCELEASLSTSRKAVESCLLSIHTAYQELLVQPGALEQCREAGRTLRYLAQCLSEFGFGSLDEEEAENDSDSESDDD